MVAQRGEVWWADLEDPVGSAPGYRRPVVIVQSDAFNRSRIRTTIGVVLTSSLKFVDAPGNVLVKAKASGLPKDSVANVTQLVSIDLDALIDKTGKLSAQSMTLLDAGLKLVLALR